MFLCDEPAREKAIRAVLRRLPALAGAPVEIARARGLRDRRGAVHAGSFLRRRRMAFDCSRAEFARIFSHELFHFRKCVCPLFCPDCYPEAGFETILAILDYRAAHQVQAQP
jgi:hypothetical protein